jgi:hypothetical protein
MNSIDQQKAETVKTQQGVISPLETSIATLSRALVGPDGVVKLQVNSSGEIAGPSGVTPILKSMAIKELSEVVTATNVITAAESGSVFYLSSATEFVSTLPAAAIGLKFTFIVSAAPSGDSYTIVSASSANIIKGVQVAAEHLGTGDSGTADDTITFVAGQAVAGDKVEVVSDGTSWFAYATSKLKAGITFTQAS